MLLLQYSAGLIAIGVWAGFDTSCALRSNHSVVCWGFNVNGQLGIGNVVNVGDVAGQTGSYFVSSDLGTGKLHCTLNFICTVLL